MLKRKLLPRLIIVLPLALIVISSLLFLLRVSRDTLNNLPEIIKTIADERINGTVQIGSIDIFPSKGIVIKDVVVTGKVNHSPLIRIPKVTLKTNLVDLILKRGNPDAAIKLIDIQEPVVSIRRKRDGHWDIHDVLKTTPGGKELQFKGKIQVRSAVLAISDYASSTTASPEINRFHNAEGVLTFPDSTHLKFNAKGVGDIKKVSDVSCSGVYNLKEKTYTVDIGLKDAAIEYWSKYPYNSKLRIHGGKANGSIFLNRYQQGMPLDYHITADLMNTALSFNGISKPISEIYGKLDLTRNLATLDLNAIFSKSPITASGYVVSFKNPKLLLNISSNRANFKEIANNVSFRDSLKFAALPDNGSLTATLTGAPSSPGVKFHVEAPSLGISSLKFSSLKLDGIYANRHILLNDSSAVCYGGSTNFNGEIDINRNPNVMLRGKANTIKIGDLPFFKGNGFTGYGSGPLSLYWKSGHLKVVYNIDIKSPEYHQYAFNNGNISGSYEDGISHIESMNTGLYGGDISASGVIGKGNTLDISVYGTDINIASVARQFWKIPTLGHGQFAGKITGTSTSPKFVGFVEGYKVVASDFQAERITASLSADMNNILINKLVLFDYPGSITLTGNISKPFDKQPTVDLTVSADSLDVDRFSEYAGIADLSGGILSADLKVTGALQKPDAEGRILLTDMLYHDIPLDVISSGISYKNQMLDIGSLKFISDKTQLTASGTIAQDQSINIKVNGTNIPLDRFSTYLKPYASLRGNLNLNGNVTGTLKSPIADVSINGDEPVINGRKFTSLSGKMNADKTKASVTNLELLESGSVYKLSSLSYDMHEKNITVNAGITDGHGAMLLSLLDSSPYVFQQSKPNERFKELLSTIPRPFNAKVNASITGTAKLTSQGIEPDLSLDSSITDLIYGSNSFKDIRMKGSWHNGILSLDQLDAIDGDTNISADASLGPKDALSVRIDVHNLPTSSLKQITKLPDNFSGKADVTIVASGSRYKPSAQMSLEIVDPVIAGTKFERLRTRFSSQGNEAGAPNADKSNSVGLINIDEITLVLNEHNFRTSGYIPVDWLDLTLKKDAPILLESTLDQDTLSFLSALTGLSIGVRQDGKFEGSVKMTGTIADPVFAGILSWKKGFVNVPRVNQPFEIDQADVSLTGNKITIDSLNGRSAQGGSFTGGGNITMIDMKPVLDMSLKANALRISGKNISNTYGEDINAEVNGDLKISGNLLTPTIKGNVVIPTGQMSIPGRAVPQTPPRVLVFDPSFDVGVSLGQNLRFKSSRLRIPLYGNINIKGPFSKINVDGKIDISNGTILFPVRSMKLLNRSKMELYVRPNQPSIINLDIQGQTRVTAITGLNQRKQYTITMTAKGNLDNLNTVFSSSPPGLTNDAIVALLTGQKQLEQLFSNQANDFGKELSGLFSSAVLPGVLGNIEQTFGSALGLEEFSLDLNYNEPVQVTLGEKLWDGVMLSYSSYLGSRPDYADSQYNIKLTKQFKGNLEIGVSVDENEIYTLLLEGRMNF